jgi:hypothetical protein
MTVYVYRKVFPLNRHWLPPLLFKGNFFLSSLDRRLLNRSRF